MYHNVHLERTNRDINSAFRQIRLRTDSEEPPAAEFRGALLGLDYADDVVILSYLLVGVWAPRVFASVSEIVTRYHNLSPPSNVLRASDRPFRSQLFVEDGILIEPELVNRLRQSASTWERELLW